LKLPATSISLAKIYAAVEDKSVFRMHKMDPKQECPVARAMGAALAPFLKSAERAMETDLEHSYLSQVVKALEKAEG
jgi:DNA-binding IscR family transcriptional regulator